MNETRFSRKAESIYREFGRYFGWSLEKCQFIVDDYQDEPKGDYNDSRHEDTEDCRTES